jgi:hypothetical protein
MEFCRKIFSDKRFKTGKGKVALKVYIFLDKFELLLSEVQALLSRVQPPDQPPALCTEYIYMGAMHPSTLRIKKCSFYHFNNY